jgi:hypothetical protein
VQLLHLVIQAIHKPGGVRWLHPVRRSFMMGPLYWGEPCPPDRRLTFWNGHAGLIEVVAGQGEVQVPALGAPVGALDPRRDEVRVARPDDAPGFEPVETGAYRALGQAGVAHQRGHRRERPAPVRPGMIGQADEHELARAGWLAAAVGRNRGQVERPRDRFDTHEAPPRMGAS